MASASTSWSAPVHYKYDVFLSFRGEDTRNSFTDYLYEALRNAGIRTFRDDDEIRKGQQLKPEINRSITESRASIIVISDNFATSTWCLDELWLILEQKRNAGHIVLPVFYGVDPSDVRNQRGRFTIEAEEGSKWTQDNVKRWKAALTEVADLKGMVVSGYEKGFIEKIVVEVYHQLGSEIRSTLTDLTGIETRAEPIISWLRSDQPDHPVLAICGMGGSGKTTLAEYVYYSNKKNFDSCSLVKDIHENGLLGVQKQLLQDISGIINLKISNVYEGAFHLQKAIQMNKVLIVVDDIDDKDKLTTLFGKSFDTKSKIIITTRLQNIDTWFGCISYGCHVHKIQLLNDHESLGLLCFHAFGSNNPIEGFEKLAGQLAQYCEGIPLALKVLGSSLPVTVQDDQWTKNNMIETWRSRMTSLNSLKGDIDNKIECVLRKSFESLPCGTHRELFLHIACFFIGEYAYKVEMALEKDWHAKSGVNTLINRCLVTKSRDGHKLAMHNLLQDMAIKIVHEESKDLEKRSRVRRKDEAYSLMRDGHGSKTIEGLLVDMDKVEQWMSSEAFKTSSLVKMRNLKLLLLNNVKLSGTYEKFPDLRWLNWYRCNLKTIPSGLLTSHLVALHISYGDLEEFDPPVVLSSLKILDLSNSTNIVSICNLIRLPKLEFLFLGGCTSLTHVCKTIRDLKNLSYMNLNRCTKLWKSNPIFISRGIPEHPLFSLPQSLSIMVLAGNSFEMLPSHIDLKRLLTLELIGCPNLKSLTCLPSMLEKLYVDWCSSLENITFQSGRFTLQVFDYEGCFKLCEIQGLFKLVSIEKLNEADLGHMQWMKAYRYHKVDLVGDVITKGRTFNNQMLYEYGIRSTFLQGINDQSMATHDYTSLSGSLSFHVPMHPMKHMIQGLYVTVIYRSSGEDRNTEPPPLFARIWNTSKDVTWVYNPVVHCKPGVDEHAIWLSYWPIGNTLDAGDEVDVDIIVEEGTIVTIGVGASVVYMDAGEAEKEEEKSEMMKSEEVIGGDLSLFRVKEGFIFAAAISSDSRRWRTHNQLKNTYEDLNDIRNPNREKLRVTLGASFNSESEISKIEKALSDVEGVESVSTQKEIKRLIVCGHFDPQVVLKRMREFEKMVQVLHCHFFSAEELKINSMSSIDAMEAWANQQKGKKLYIVFISLHGLIRGENMELGRDSDTGVQDKYIVELARALASMPVVYRVDLITRQVASPEVDWTYGEPTEMLSPHNPDAMADEIEEYSGAYIIRIPFGPKDKYIPKELLWPHIPEFVDGALSHIIQMSKVLGEQFGGGHPVWPVAIHGHYADGGDSAARLSGALNVPMLFTGHSFGRDKLEQLLRQGRLTIDEINATYKIRRRIEAEELSLDSSEVVITSTRHEIEEQWRLYDGFDPVLERKLRARIRRNVSCYGKFMSRMVVIPPGMEFNHIVTHDGETEGGENHPPTPDPPIWAEIMRFVTNPRKPMILALAGPDPEKNLTTLVKAFGECRPLRDLANLTLIMGNRDNIDKMSSTSASMRFSVIKLVEKYDLYGQVAYPKHHKQSEVPDIYRLAAKTKGVFINPAFIEPFGLALIEAAAHGLPMVATKNGGPVDIHRVLDNDKQLWAKCRANGLRNIHLFSWTEHCKTYLSRIAGCKPRKPGWLKNDDDDDENSEPDSPNDSLRDMQDISLNLKFSIGFEVQTNKQENDVSSYSKNVGENTQKMASGDKNEQLKFLAIRRRTHVFVIAIDGDDIKSLFENIEKIFNAVESEKREGSIGFILATSLPMAQIHSLLVSKAVNPLAFDAFICNSGADLYYSSSHSEDNPFVFDLYYHSHIEYRWGGEELRKTLVKWASSITDKKAEHVVTEDEQVSTNYCYAFNINKPGLVPPVKELRKLMRIQALRCHVIYCQNGKKMNVIPVSASRSQALRYLYLRWGMDLSKVVVFVGESGDTDYEGFLGGVHKSVILKGIGGGATNPLHANRVYPLSDVTPTEGTNIVHTPEDFSAADIRASLRKLGVLNA